MLQKDKKERKKSETEVEVDGTKELHVTLSPRTPAGDPPETEELIKALMVNIIYKYNKNSEYVSLAINYLICREIYVESIRHIGKHIYSLTFPSPIVILQFTIFFILNLFYNIFFSVLLTKILFIIYVNNDIITLVLFEIYILCGIFICFFSFLQYSYLIKPNFMKRMSFILYSK